MCAISFASTAFQRQVLLLLGPGCQKHHQQVRLPLGPIISGSITSTTLTTWDRLVCSLTGLMKITWQIHKIPNTEQLNLLLLFGFVLFCVHLLPAWPLFTSHVVVYLSWHFICLFNTHLYLFFLLVFPPISILLRDLAMCSYERVCLCFTGSDVPVCVASKDGWVNIMYHGLDAVAVDQQVMLFM